jgi:vanillate O-demethylase ferredoxin subunit
MFVQCFEHAVQKRHHFSIQKMSYLLLLTGKLRDRMTLRACISRVWDETTEIKCFELRAMEGEILPPIQPGAHIDVHLGNGLTRQYSLWNGPTERDAYFIGVKREPESRGGSAAMHRLTAGQVLEIGEPRNNFRLADTSGLSLLLAGGIGITPLLSMLRFLESQNRRVQLHLFSRSVALSPFHALLNGKPNVTQHIDLLPPKLDAVLTNLLAAGQPDDHVYLCGPARFMELAQTIATASGWPASQIHLEYFISENSPTVTADTEFELVLHKSAKRLIVKSDQTIVAAMREAGVDILTSCEQGVCGTCVTAVIEGEPDHRDVYFNSQERALGKLITPCVSRCKGKRLVLDL